ncbi:MAG TPA: N-methyl-L-tryptophan oxidase [Verrucomicrobiae bacterium]|nr:N-methyl-L-tryptophan oxidase [Verrucomicrobiae bacterium]
MQPHQSKWDVIVVGLGAVGATAYQLSRRHGKVLGLDRFHPPHNRGSSHGETRITRLALGEGEHYVPFVRRSHEIWRELEAAAGRSLMRNVGGLIYGSSSSRTSAHGADDFLRTTIEVAKRHGIAHEVLDAAKLRERFPQFHLCGDETGYYEPEAGYLLPEVCIATQLELAQATGADIRTGEWVLDWQASPTGVSVTTDRSRYEADRLILCAGPWLPDLVKPLAPRVKVFRQTLFWFQPDGPSELFSPDRMPVFIRVPDAQTEMVYGFPMINGLEGGLKVAGEQFDRAVAPDDVDDEVHEAEKLGMHKLASSHVRISPRCVRATACKYTVTPDFGFVIDRHPDSERVWFASACSGHGFKHSAAVGEALAEMTLQGSSRLDLSRFRLVQPNSAY